MNSVDLVKSLCKFRKIPISRLEKDLNFSNGYIGQLKKGTFPDDRLKQIAEYLGVTVNYLLGNTDLVMCPICGFGNNPLSEHSELEHLEFHQKFLNLKQKYPFLMNYSDSKKNQLIAIEELRTHHNPEKRADIFMKYFQALYSQELQMNGYEEIYGMSFNSLCERQIDRTLAHSNSYDGINPETIDWLNKKYNIKYNSNVVMENSKYYINDDTAKAAQEIFENKELRVLFDAARDASPEDLHTVHSMLMALKRKERGDYDEGC